jgi:Family of unknown function (DUF6459)
MPTRTRTPDLLAPAGQVPRPELPAAATPDQPPAQAGKAAHDGPAAQDRPAGGPVHAGELDQDVEPPWSGLRLVAVPAGWPPYDCETHGAACPAADLEAGHMPPRSEAADEAALAWNAVPASAGANARTSGAGEASTGEASTGEARVRGPDQTPGLRVAWAGQFAQVLVEVLAGYRPPKQLIPLTTERVRAHVDLLSCAVATGQRPRIQRVMTSRPAAGVVEMTMVVSFGPRSRALATRFEHVPARPPVPGRPARPARWLCTEIEADLPDLAT